MSRARQISQKSAAETAIRNIKLAAKLAEGETLTAVASATVSPSGGNHVTISASSFSDVRAQLTFEDGESEELFTADGSTDTLTIASHHFTDGDEVWLEGANLPSPLKDQRTYYVRDATASTFKLTETKDDDGDLGEAVDLSEDGEGLIGHDYVVTVRCNTSTGQVVEGECILRVKG